MITIVQSIVVVLLGYGLLVVQSTIATLASIDPFIPNLLLPLTIYLGVSSHVPLVRGAVMAFILGYLLDTFCGNRLSLQTFMLVSTYLLARSAGLKIFLRAPLFQVLLTFVVSAIVAASTMMLRAIFEDPPPFSLETWKEPTMAVVAPSISTAISAPFVFWVIRLVDSAFVERAEESRL